MAEKKNGKIIGEYRIVSKIADGGFGVTYRAEHLTLGTPVCIKHASHVSPADEELLLDEARAMWDLRHYGVPAVRDLIRLPDSSLALVMSYIPGRTVSEIRDLSCHEHGMDPEHVAWIGERCLNVLKYLHMEHGVIHGDVKPQNIIVQNDTHTVVMVDYGLSQIKPTRSDTAKGYTPYFAAPEQVAGQIPIPETDFYGLAMTMVYALGGDVVRIKVPEAVPDPLCQFIKRLLRRDPLSRPRWETEDLVETMRIVRRESFGRTHSNMKPLVVS